MNPDTLVVLGATGQTGRRLARLLLERTTASLVLAGRDPGRLQALATSYGAVAAGRVRIARADAADPASLRAAFAGARLVVIAASVSRHVETVARACLDSGADAFDLIVSRGKLAALKALEPEMVRAGRCYMTDGGFHPGLPALMVRALAPAFDRIERANVHSVIQIDWRGLAFSPSTVDEFLVEILGAEMGSYRGGRWRAANWIDPADYPSVDFGPPFGRRMTMPMALAEMRALPALFPSLRDTGFYVGGFNAFVDWIVFPLTMLALRIAPRAARAPSGALLLWGLRTFSRPPFGTMLRLEASGSRAGRPAAGSLELAHGDGYALTAIAAVAAIGQLLQGEARRPGLWLQALAVEPGRMLRDLAAMGVRVTRQAPA